MRLALFQPDIPQNVGACIRLSACFGVDLHVIEPTGFRFDDRAMKRAALDYGPLSHMTRHADWEAFQRERDRGTNLYIVGDGHPNQAANELIEGTIKIGGVMPLTGETQADEAVRKKPIVPPTQACSERTSKYISRPPRCGWTRRGASGRRRR